MSGEHYSSPAAVEAAIASAARKAFEADASLTISERIRLEHFHRFLSRIFAESEDSCWVLKGGTGMLARVASARATTDVDLARRGQSLADALDDLKRLAAIDLGDYFRFDYTGHSAAVDGNQQTHVEGYRVSFDTSVGAKKKGSLHVDLVVGVVMTDDIEVTTPANVLDLPKLTSSRYRLYPIVDQIADKVCATVALYGGKPSSREKDLVDLVVLAATQEIDATKLRRAIDVEAGVRSLTLPDAFSVPPRWGARYAKLASTVPACALHPNIGAATALMREFIDPVLNGRAAGMSWDARHTRWE